MLGLVDYGTDDDDDNNNDNNSSNSNVINANKTTITTTALSSSSSSSSTTTTTTSSSSVTINDKGQKVKKLDFSILPKEIQEALAMSKDDDDDDDDDDKKIKRNSVNSNKGTKGNLLSLLPKPKHSIDNSNTTTITNDKSDVKSKGFNYVSLSESTSTKKDDISNKHNDINDDDDDDDGTDANPILFDINSYNKPQQASSFSSSSSSAAATITQKENPPSQTIAWEQYYANDAPVGPTLPSDQHIQNYSNYNYNQDYNMQYQEIDNNQQSNPNNKRKRERDIEQLLLNGNVDAIQELGNIQEINKVNQWNQVQYLNQKEMAQQIHQQYSINKAGMTNITSVQNKRHQINSLALKAAETELALLDSRTNLARNKQQAKQKYGW